MNNRFMRVSLSAGVGLAILASVHACGTPIKLDNPNSTQPAPAAPNLDMFFSPASNIEVLRFEACSHKPLMGKAWDARVYRCTFAASKPWFVERLNGKTCLLIDRNVGGW